MPHSDKTQLAIEDPDEEKPKVSTLLSDLGDQRVIILPIWVWRESRRREVSYKKHRN